MRVKIDRFGINGEGIAKLDDGKLVFIEGALPDEEVEINIAKNTKNYCYGVVENVLKASKDRVNPRCKYFNVCGGCDLQHINKNAQLEIKKKFVKDTIKKIAKIDIDDVKIVYGTEWGYRNKMVFPIGSKNNRAYIGMFQKNSNNVVPIEKCLIAKDQINYIISLLKDYIENNFVGYDFVNNKGDIKYLVIRESDGGVLITLVVSEKFNLEKLNNILCKHLKSYGISQIISNNSKDILGGKYYHIYGNKQLTLNEKSIIYKLDNRGFMQVNDEIKGLLYENVLENLKVEDNVIDAFSGAGLLTAIISQKCKNVIGIEINASACQSARDLIERNRITNVKYYEGDVKNILCKNNFNGFNTIVLDPPRSGCDKVILEHILLNADIQKIIYVSCNPSTLARDLNVLKEKFKICDITLFEMFPNTKHVETLVVLERK